MKTFKQIYQWLIQTQTYNEYIYKCFSTLETKMIIFFSFYIYFFIINTKFQMPLLLTYTVGFCLPQKLLVRFFESQAAIIIYFFLKGKPHTQGRFKMMKESGKIGYLRNHVLSPRRCFDRLRASSARSCHLFISLTMRLVLLATRGSA